MLTIKLFLAESGSVASVEKDFPLYQGQFQNILLNVFVPLSTLAPDFKIVTENGQYDGVDTPYVAGSAVSVACRSVKRNGTIAISKSYNLRFVKTISKNGIGYALYERKLPKEFTHNAGVAPAGLTMICNVTNVNYGQIDEQKTEIEWGTSAQYNYTINYSALSKKLPAVSSKYKFVWDAQSRLWYLNGDAVSLSDYGILLNISSTLQDGYNFTLAVVATSPAVISVLTTQTAKYDVFPSADIDGETPDDATAVEELQAQMNSATARISAVESDLPKKQNIDERSLETSAKTIPSAINELNAESNALDVRVTKNAEDIGKIKELATTGISYIGTLTYEGDDAPNDAQLTAYATSITGSSTLLGGEFVLAFQKIPDDTDAVYICIYSAHLSQWQIAEVPPVELASDSAAGLIRGGDNDARTVYVKISNGYIQDISVKPVGSYTPFKVSGLWQLNKDLQDIKSGAITVPKAESAAKDSIGNTISSFYMPASQGATKAFVRQYALPVEFNDALYVSSGGLVKNVPTTPASGEQFSVSSSATGYTTLFTVAYNLNNDGGTKFQVSSKNSFNANLFVKATRQEYVQFVVDISAGSDSTGANNTVLSTSVTLDTPVSATLSSVSISSLFNELGDKILSLDGTAGNVYIVAKVSVFRSSSSTQRFTILCNSTYRSCFHLSTAFQTVAVTSGKVGELPQMIFTGSYVSGSDIIFTPQMALPPENSVIHVVLPAVADANIGKIAKLSIGGDMPTISVPNAAQATVSDLLNSRRNNSGYDFLMTYTVSNGVGTFYAQQGYEKKMSAMQFPFGEQTVTFDETDGLAISATGKVTYEDAIENPQMDISVPIKAGDGISMDASDDNKFLVIKNADHSAISDKLDKATSTAGTVKLYGVSGSTQGTYTASKTATASSIAQRDSSGALLANQGTSMTSVVVLNTVEPIVVNPSPSTAVQGTITAEQLARLQQNSLSGTYTRPGILMNNEYYTLMDKGHTSGYLGYSHVGYENNTMFIKNITITISTRAWKLSTVAVPKTKYKHNIRLTKDVGSDEGYCINFTIETADQNSYSTFADFFAAIGEENNMLTASGVTLDDQSTYMPNIISYIIPKASNRFTAGGTYLTVDGGGGGLFEYELTITSAVSFIDSVTTY